LEPFNRFISLGRYRFGFTHDCVFENSEPYLERWILWLGITIRLHKFHKGDDDRAFHDHPWWFVTIPMRPYLEQMPNQPIRRLTRLIPQFRSAYHRHMVALIDGAPVWTLILTGPKQKEWGFWEEDNFIHHRQWLERREQ
jgi:hypothetical protein